MRGRALILACALVLVASSQETPAFRSNVELVAIPCAVVDSQGGAVQGLTRQDFRVTDNGARRIVESFWVDTDLPLNLGVLIDASESQRDRIPEHRETARKLLAKILRPGDRAFVIEVAEDLRLWADLTGAAGEPFGEPCPKQLSGLRGFPATSVCGASPLWNALYDAARLKLRPLTGNKALLILTDGFDTGSTHTWQQAAAEAHRADAAVYAIQYPGGFGGTFAPELYRLISETGGASFPPPEGAFDSIVARLETDLRRRYVLGFRPEKLSGKARHQVEVEVTRADLTVRARKVYFEPAP
jgi:VWFA-related protein